jgi:hypothetical protein
MTFASEPQENMPAVGDTATLYFPDGSTGELIVTGYTDAHAEVKFRPEQPDAYSRIALDAFKTLVVPK